MSADDFAQAYKYFIFTEIKIKAIEIEAPQLAQAPTESVTLLFLCLDANH